MTDHPDWEFFQDEGYFGMWCVREKGARRFGEGFHTVSKEEAEALASALSSQSLSLSEARAENERLRAALAQSDLPCAYCSLPKDEWAKCASGFPGCDRADDAMGCPELGARLSIESATRQRDEALAALKASEEARDAATKFADRYGVALMMIRAGCSNPQRFAGNILDDVKPIDIDLEDLT